MVLSPSVTAHFWSYFHILIYRLNYFIKYEHHCWFLKLFNVRHSIMFLIKPQKTVSALPWYVLSKIIYLFSTLSSVLPTFNAVRTDFHLSLFTRCRPAAWAIGSTEPKQVENFISKESNRWNLIWELVYNLVVLYLKVHNFVFVLFVQSF